MLRTVAQEDSVGEEVVNATRKYPRAEDVFDAAIWRISRDPRCGSVVGHGSPERRLVYFPPIKTVRSPGLLVRYYLEDNEGRVVIDWIKFFDYSEKDAVSPREYVIPR